MDANLHFIPPPPVPFFKGGGGGGVGWFLNPNPRGQVPKRALKFEKQTAKHFLKLKKFKTLGIPGKLYEDYFNFNIYLLRIPFSIGMLFNIL